MQGQLLRIERITKLGQIGEALVEDCLPSIGFSQVKNLNKTRRNYPFADILAIRNGETFFIGVKSRNEFQANGEINPTYNAVLIRDDKKRLLEAQGKTTAEITGLLWAEVHMLAKQFSATPAWATVAMRPRQGTYSAYSMKVVDRGNYEALCEHKGDARITPDLINQ